MIAETGTLLSNRGSAKFAKGRKLGHRVSKGSKCSLGILVTLFFGLVGFTLLGSNYSHVISISGNSLEEGSDETLEWKSGRKPGHMSMMETTRWVSNVIGFGHSTIVSGQDSRYWDRDDRRRDGDYLVDNPHVSNDDSNGTIEGRDILHGKGQFENNEGNSFTLSKETEHFKDPDRHNKSLIQLRVGHNSGNLYNEQNRQELRKYEELYEVDMKRKNGINGNVIVEKMSYANADESDGNDLIHKNFDDIDIDSAVAGYSDANLNNVHGGILPLSSDIQIHGSGSASHKLDEKLSENGVDKKNPFQQVQTSNEDVENFFKEDSPSLTSTLPQEVKTTTSKENTNSSKLKHRRRPNLPCEVPFLNSSEGILEPHNNSKFISFSLQFVGREGKPDAIHAWKPRFAGHQSLYEREKSFYARDQTIHCGFVKGPQDYSSTGFDLSEKDTGYLQKCHIAVSSCIFGNSDNIRTPTRRKMSQNAKKNICFVMFIDEKTLETLFSEGRKPDENGHIGLWKIIVVKNLPYSDMRRVGKVPKFLSHRLFPSARYSIWIDSKMRLDSDPLLILDYFLWQGDFEYAISNHYNRHCVWEEVMQNKRLNKYNHTAIDEQFAFYQADGLAKFNNSDPNKILPSYVPEGSFIVRAHTPMSNLFSCLWFNEVDRFTSRDQLSFAYTFLKLKRMNPGKDFRLNMFKDCERRFMAKIFHHKYEVRLPKSKTI